MTVPEEERLSPEEKARLAALVEELGDRIQVIPSKEKQDTEPVYTSPEDIFASISPERLSRSSAVDAIAVAWSRMTPDQRTALFTGILNPEECQSAWEDLKVRQSVYERILIAAFGDHHIS